MFRMTIGKREVTAPVVPERWEVHPLVSFRGEAKMSIVDAEFMFIEKDTGPGRRRTRDLRGLFINVIAFLAKVIQADIHSVHVPIDGIAAHAQEVAARDFRTAQVGWAAIDCRRLVILVQGAFGDQSGVGGIHVVVLHVSQDPGFRAGANIWIVHDDRIAIIIGIQHPAKLQLLQVPQADRLLPFKFRFAQGGQQHARENGDNGNDDQ